jgi:hypothetical protein
MGSLWGWGPAFNVVLSSYRYALSPDRLQARTVSSARLIAWGTIPLASLLAGGLLQGAGSRQTLLILGAIMVVVASAATARRIVRNAPQVADLRPTELGLVPRRERDAELAVGTASDGHARPRVRLRPRCLPAAGTVP